MSSLLGTIRTKIANLFHGKSSSRNPRPNIGFNSQLVHAGVPAGYLSPLDQVFARNVFAMVNINGNGSGNGKTLESRVFSLFEVNRDRQYGVQEIVELHNSLYLSYPKVNEQQALEVLHLLSGERRIIIYEIQGKMGFQYFDQISHIQIIGVELYNALKLSNSLLEVAKAITQTLTSAFALNVDVYLLSKSITQEEATQIATLSDRIDRLENEMYFPQDPAHQKIIMRRDATGAVTVFVNEEPLRMRKLIRTGTGKRSDYEDYTDLGKIYRNKVLLNINGMVYYGDIERESEKEDPTNPITKESVISYKTNCEIGPGEVLWASLSCEGKIFGFVKMVNWRQKGEPAADNHGRELKICPLFSPNLDRSERDSVYSTLQALFQHIASRVAKIKGQKGGNIQSIWEREERSLSQIQIVNEAIQQENPTGNVNAKGEVLFSPPPIDLYKTLKKAAASYSNRKFRGKDKSSLEARLFLLENPAKSVPSSSFNYFCQELARVSREAWGDSPSKPVAGYTDEFVKQHFAHADRLLVIFDSKSEKMVAFAGIKEVSYESNGALKKYLMIEVAMVVPEHQGKRLSGIAVQNLINDALIENNLKPIFIALRTQNPNVVEPFASTMGKNCFPNPFYVNLCPSPQLLEIARHAAQYTSQGHSFNEATFVVTGVYPPESGLVYSPGEVPWWKGDSQNPFNQYLDRILGYTKRQPAEAANALIFAGQIDPEVIIAYDRKNHVLSSWKLRVLRLAKKALNWLSAT